MPDPTSPTPASAPDNSGEQPVVAGNGSHNTAANTEPAQAAPALSKEEQMAAFEEDLKINDWGHQPC